MSREEELRLLRMAGAGRGSLARYAEASGLAEQLQVLRQIRRCLLDQIHLRERMLAEIDLLLYQKQEEKDI